MQWIHHYQLFLFDFDGILVNTEELHYKAYLKMCADRGFELTWDEKTYVRHAMCSATGLKEGIYREFPKLYQSEPDWNVLYLEKKQLYSELLNENRVSLMPGVEPLLIALEKANIKRCVVTNSIAEHIAVIRERHPILDSIPHWITREFYQEPKPSAECYLKAIDLHGSAGDKVIGFEDSPRGLQALLGTKAERVFISELFEKEEVRQFSAVRGAFEHVPSFPALFTLRAC